VNQLDVIIERIRVALDHKNTARDTAYRRSRQLTRFCANAIRAAHRADWDQAHSLLSEAREAASELVQDLADYQDLYLAGYTQDALKEWVEAECTCALIAAQPLPSPEELQVEQAAYLNGLAEAASEMRRHALDLMRRDELDRAEEILGAMDEIYGLLVTVDFPDAITRGLRRRTDSLRGVLERTRGDLTIAVRQERLRRALRSFEARVAGRGDGASRGVPAEDET
jgi:translin